jgi:archaellum component FlaF (FlaF/FlaG flagellin family)
MFIEAVEKPVLLKAQKEEDKKRSIFNLIEVSQNHEPLDISKSHCLQRVKRNNGNSRLRTYKVINDGLFVSNDPKNRKSMKGELLFPGEIITIRL